MKMSRRSYAVTLENETDVLELTRSPEPEKKPLLKWPV
jgi:hypothetical protein